MSNGISIINENGENNSDNNLKSDLENKTLENNSTEKNEPLFKLEKPKTAEELGYQSFSQSNSFSWGNYASSVSIIILMLLMFYGGLWLLRKYGKGRFLPLSSSFSRNDLRLEAQLPLSQKRTLYVVKYLNRRILLGGTDNSLTLLSEDYILSEEQAGEGVKSFESALDQIAEQKTQK